MLCRCHPLLSVLVSEKLREPGSAHISVGQTPARTARCTAQLKLLPTGRRLVRHPISGHSRSSRPIRVKNPSRITLRTMLSPGFSIVPWPDLNRQPSGYEARDTGFRASRNSRKTNQNPRETETYRHRRVHGSSGDITRFHIGMSTWRQRGRVPSVETTPHWGPHSRKLRRAGGSASLSRRHTGRSAASGLVSRARRPSV